MSEMVKNACCQFFCGMLVDLKNYLFEDTEELIQSVSPVQTTRDAHRSRVRCQDADAIRFQDNLSKYNFSKSDKEAFRLVTDKIVGHLIDSGFIDRREEVGSAAEGTEIPYGSDFDVLLVANDDVKITTFSGIPAYARLERDGKCLSPTLMMTTTIKDIVQKFINGADFGDLSVYMTNNSPAIQVDVARNNRRIISIDMVPAIEKDGQMFVAKPPPHDSIIYLQPLGENTDRMFPTSSNSNEESKFELWRISHSVEAREHLKSLSPDQKLVYKICKVICKSEDGLQLITSYQLKCTFLRLVQDATKIWSKDTIKYRVLDLLGAVRDAYRSRRLFDYYERISLISEMYYHTQMRIANHLDALIQNHHRLFNLDRIARIQLV